MLINNCNLCGLKEVCKEDKQGHCEKFELHLKHEIKADNETKNSGS